MHAVASKAVCFKEALQDDFKTYAANIIANAQAMAEELIQGGLKLISNGTDNHLILADVTSLGSCGQIAEDALDRCGITVNKNMIPFDERKPMDPSGIRIGTSALTTRGMGTDQMQEIAGWILQVLKSSDHEGVLNDVGSQVKALCQHFPVPAGAIAV